MKISLFCNECADKDGIFQSIVKIPPTTSSIYDFQCAKGHTTKIILIQNDFEILFEIGVHAILDGYYREAISSFASALERFYEFALHVLCKNSTISDDVYKKTWGQIKKQSERQLGAFIFLWLAFYKSPPSILNSQFTQIRNEVVHKGHIPTKQQAIEFGNHVFSLINDKILMLRTDFEEILNAMEKKKIVDASQSGVFTANGILTLVSVSLPRSAALAALKNPIEEHIAIIQSKPQARLI